MLLACCFFMFILTTCHITYIVRLDGTDLYGKMEMPCGYGKVFLRGRGKRYFSLWQIFYLKGEARYHTENINILLNGTPLPIETKNATHNSETGHSEFKVHDGDTIVSSFFIPEGVFEEDTIVIKTTRLLSCDGTSSGDEMWFYFYFNRNEFIRIH